MADCVTGNANAATEDITAVPGGSGSQPTAQEKVKHEWYQTDCNVTVALLIKHVKPERVKIDFLPTAFSAVLELESGETKQIDMKLAHEIIPSDCTYKVLSTKVEIKLIKRYGHKWMTLEPAEPPKASAPVKETRKWENIIVEDELEDGRLDGESELNKLFQKIYSQGSDDMRKAMNKSFVESGGTVLSTNWSEVGRDKVEIKPPDGMEWKKWDC